MTRIARQGSLLPHRPSARLALFLVLAASCRETPAELVGPVDGPEPPIALPLPQFSLTVFDLTELPVWEGSLISQANGINDHGQIVGSIRHSSGVDIAVVWENGAVKTLPTLGGSNGAARDINNLGHVVGLSQLGSGQWRPTLWKNGTAQDLGTLGGIPFNALGSHATAINDRGQVVGISRASSGQEHAFLWEDGVMQDLGTLGGGVYSIATDLNESGQIVGVYRNSAYDQRAFLWQDGVMQDLGTLGGAVSVASGINELGQVVGTSLNSQNEARGFLWENGVMQDLGPVNLTGINDLGQAVGFHNFKAYVVMDGEHHSLGSEMPHAINNHGLVVGRYYNSANEQRPVLWMVPIRPPVDLQPGDAANVISLKKTRTVTVAILSNPWFSAQQVDPATVTLGDEQASDTPVIRDRRGKLSAVYRDIDGDGDKDLVLGFSAAEMIAKGDLTSSVTKLVLLGKRTDGRPLRAVEAVTIQ